MAKNTQPKTLTPYFVYMYDLNEFDVVAVLLRNGLPFAFDDSIYAFISFKFPIDAIYYMLMYASVSFCVRFIYTFSAETFIIISL